MVSCRVHRILRLVMPIKTVSLRRCGARCMLLARRCWSPGALNVQEYHHAFLSRTANGSRSGADRYNRSTLRILGWPARHLHHPCESGIIPRLSLLVPARTGNAQRGRLGLRLRFLLRECHEMRIPWQVIGVSVLLGLVVVEGSIIAGISSHGSVWRVRL